MALVAVAASTALDARGEPPASVELEWASPIPTVPARALQLAGSETRSDLALVRRTTTTSTSTTTTTIGTPSSTDAVPAEPTPTDTTVPTAVRTRGTALCIGDSVMLGASPALYDTLSMCRIVDATTSRQFRHGDDVVRDYRDRGQLGEVVVVHLGTNGPVTAAEFDDLLRALRGVDRVAIVNVQTHGRRSWEAETNAVLAAGVRRWRNTVLLDWRGFSQAHPDWFASDGIHLSAAGAGGYAALIAGFV